MIYVGMDVGSKSFFVHAINERKRVVFRGEIPATRSALRATMRGLGSAKLVAFEAGNRLKWIAMTLKRIEGVHVHVVHPNEVKWISHSSRKTDQVDARKLVGIVSDRDLKDASPSKATSLDVYELNYVISTINVASIMARDLVFVRPDETIEFSSILMLENKISSLPVVKHIDSLVGIITQTDIFKALINIAGIYTGGIQSALSLEDRPRFNP